VTYVRTAPPADQSGLQTGDVITALNDKPIRNTQELRNKEGLLLANSQVSLSLLRAGRPHTILVRLAPEKIAVLAGASLDKRLTGITLNDLSRDQRSQGLHGVQVSAVQPGSDADRAGLQHGAIIIGVGNRRIRNLHTLSQLVRCHPPGQLVLIVADKRGAVRYIALH
jgi:serine protease Do/serine protease DegQ